MHAANQARTADHVANAIASRLALRAIKREARRLGTAVNFHVTGWSQFNELARQAGERIRTSPSYRRRVEGERQQGAALRQQQAEQRAATRAQREAGADRVSAASKAELLAALDRRREGAPLVIVLAGGSGRWNLPAATGADFKASQARIRSKVARASDAILFKGASPKPAGSAPPSRSWRTAFADFVADGEHENAEQLADLAGADLVFGHNTAGQRPNVFERVRDIGDGFAVVRQLAGSGRSVDPFTVMAVEHGLTVGRFGKIPDELADEFEAQRARAVEAAARLVPVGREAYRRHWLTGSPTGAQP